MTSFPRSIRLPEKRLHKQGLLTSHAAEQAYFRKDVYFGPVQDDHIPFLNKGVCINTYNIINHYK